jgi:hypothetical protein
MKTCIWCSKTEVKVPFIKEAHTIPQSLGGIFICENVCDACNHYFGSYHDGYPPVETILKEAFNISRMKFLHSNGQVGKNKLMPKFSSIYFNVNFSKHRIDLKPQFKLHKNFQEKICRQLKRGIYKVYLEELERQTNSAHDQRYDFIREFARYNLNDLPVFYFNRRLGVILMAKDYMQSPKLYFNPDERLKYFSHNECFYEFELFGHALSIATSKNWRFHFNDYFKDSFKRKSELFLNCKEIIHFNDFDLTLSILDI